MRRLYSMFVQFFCSNEEKKLHGQEYFSFGLDFLFLCFSPRGTKPPQEVGEEVFCFSGFQEEPNTPCPPKKKFGGFFLLSWPLRGIEITQGNLGGFFLLYGLYQQMNLPRIFFGGAYCLFKEVFLLGSIFKELILLTWLLSGQQVSQELGFETLRRESKLSVYEEDGRILQMVYQI